MLIALAIGCGLYHDLRRTTQRWGDVAEAWRGAGTNISSRVNASEARAAETHRFWQEFQRYVIYALGVAAVVWREKVQELITKPFTRMAKRKEKPDEDDT